MENIEAIEMYVEGTLTGTALAEFEQNLRQDSALRSEVEMYRDIIQGIRHKGENEFLHMVHQWERELSAKDVMMEKNAEGKASDADASRQNTGKTAQQAATSGASVWKLWGKIAAAASVLILVGVGYFTFLNSSDPKSVFQDAFKPYTGEVISRDASSELEKAIAAYKAKDYVKAKQGFDKILDTNPDSTVVNLYAGVTDMALGDAVQAADQLQKVVNSNNVNFQDDASWYLAILPLQNGNKQEAIIRLEEIRNTTGHAYREQAKAILKKLK